MTHQDVAIVTGAGSGIGLAPARRLLSQGRPVVAADPNAEALHAFEEDISGPGPAFMDVLGLDAGAAGFVGVNRGSTGQGSFIRRKDG
ncbi:SDR family NAD(P)-dependent oxidoreductase [Sinosporangium siamense]|uniref:SDR family NAD(P)-dependent oxidoreductase n=1 Tax=Sinosporangium siamense TaxID=1367973 RepID=A0A919VG81_9ACTN|nr:SDR family NAD(P)-dependent oxidoreductase [Sinosporangium siamense]GII96844.1 hypothetical protein Ssi02_70750 [Sinosporangium siamense]